MTIAMTIAVTGVFSLDDPGSGRDSPLGVGVAIGAELVVVEREEGRCEVVTVGVCVVKTRGEVVVTGADESSDGGECGDDREDGGDDREGGGEGVSGGCVDSEGVCSDEVRADDITALSVGTTVVALSIGVKEDSVVAVPTSDVEIEAPLISGVGMDTGTSLVCTVDMGTGALLLGGKESVVLWGTGDVVRSDDVISDTSDADGVRKAPVCNDDIDGSICDVISNDVVVNGIKTISDDVITTSDDVIVTDDEAMTVS